MLTQCHRELSRTPRYSGRMTVAIGAFVEVSNFAIGRITRRKSSVFCALARTIENHSRAALGKNLLYGS